MAEKKSTLVKAETRSGIKLVIDERIKEDARLLFYLSKLQDKNIPDIDKNPFMFQFFELIFGTDGLPQFLNEVAAHHDGIADVRSLLEEVNDIFEALKLKN